MDDRVVILEHVDLIDIGQLLHAYKSGTKIWLVLQKQHHFDKQNVRRSGGTLTEFLDSRLELLVLRDLDGLRSKLLGSSLGT